MKKENGIAGVLLLLLTVAVLVAAYFVYSIYVGQKTVEERDQMYSAPSVTVFEKIPESNSTPEEIDNNTLNEMDNLVNSVDDPGDLSDLEY